MIDNEDIPTLPRPVQHAADTIQVPAENESQLGLVEEIENEQQTASIADDEPVEDEKAPTPQSHLEAPVAARPTQHNEPPKGEDITAIPTPGFHALSIADLLALRIASDPQLSPDGLLIAFTVQENNAEKNTTSSSIWLVETTTDKTKSPWQVSSGEQHDMTPRWSPDGSTLAFISTRTGAPQIFLLPMRGGEARQFSNLKTGVADYVWRPDGQVILAQGPWKPGDDREEPEEEDAPLIYTRLDAQWDGLGHKEGRHQQLWFLPLEGMPQRLTSEPVDLTQAAWSPDGSEIAFCANRRPDPDLSVSLALWVLTLATGEMRRLTPETGLAQMPSWSPDGKSIAYLYTEDQTEASNILPWIVDAHDAQTARPALANIGDVTCMYLIIDELRMEMLSAPLWYPDGKALLTVVQEKGQVHLYRLDLVGKQFARLTGGNGRYISPQISRNGQSIACIRADWFTPGDVWCMDGDGKKPRKLTGVNDGLLRNRQLIRPKRITWQAEDGLEIEGWLYLPAQASQSKVPLILEIHGGPSLAWGDAYVHEFQVLTSKGYAVLAANPRGSAGYGEEFCRKSLNDWGGDDYKDLMAGIEHVIATEAIDGERLGIGGLSYGGYMTDWTISQTQRFKGAVSRNGISSIRSAALLSDQTLWFNMSLEEEIQTNRSALSHVEQITTPLLLLHAENDLRCPFTESLQLFVELRKRKRPVELVRYHRVSHLLDWPGFGSPRQRVDRMNRTIQWFERFV